MRGWQQRNAGAFLLPSEGTGMTCSSLPADEGQALTRSHHLPGDLPEQTKGILLLALLHLRGGGASLLHSPPASPRAMISAELLHSPIIGAADSCTARVRSTGLVSPTGHCQHQNNISSFLTQLSQSPLQAAEGCWPSSYRSSWRCWSSRCWFGPIKVLHCQVSGCHWGTAGITELCQGM